MLSTHLNEKINIIPPHFFFRRPFYIRLVEYLRFKSIYLRVSSRICAATNTRI